MGIVTKSIGIGGTHDYTSLQAWEDALPADLVSDGNSQVGECYFNGSGDGAFTGSTQLLLISGETTDATHTITLTTGAGQSFRDNANKLTNPLAYNSAVGVGIDSTVAASVIKTTVNNVFFKYLQIRNTGAYGSCLTTEGATSVTVDSIIAQNGPSASGTVAFTRGSQTVTNSLFLMQRDSGIALMQGSVGLGIGFPDCYNCTFVVSRDVTTPATSAIKGTYSTGSLENCAFFGCTAVSAGSTTFTFTTCMTDVASPPSGVTGGKTYSAQFASSTIVLPNYQAKAGNDLQAGTLDVTNAPLDIIGQTRASPCTIGCWEFIAASTGRANRLTVLGVC